MNFVEREKEVERVLERRQSDLREKYESSVKAIRHIRIYDGPPTANGKPHIGHVADPCYQGYDSEIPYHERLSWFREKQAGIPTDCR